MTYILIKSDNEIGLDPSDSDLDHMCEIEDEAGLENFIVCVLNALCEREVNWSVPQIAHVRQAIEQVIHEQGLKSK